MAVTRAGGGPGPRTGTGTGTGARTATADRRAHHGDAARTPDGAQGPVARGRRLWARWTRTRAARALARFNATGGGVLTGGIAYNALFSVFAGLTLGYTIFMAVLGGNDALRRDVLAAVDANLPGLVDTGDGRGLVDPDDLVISAGLSFAGLGAIAVLVFSALRSMAALRTAVRAVSGRPTAAQNLLVGKLRELAGVAGVAVAILASAALSLALTGLAGAILEALGWDEAAQVVGRVLGILVAFVVDAAMFVLIVVVLGGLRPPRRDLLQGAVLAAVGMGLLRLLGTSVVAGSANSNALLAGFTVLVTLLVWINLLARVVLLAAAWTADPPMPEDDDVVPGAEDGADGAARAAGTVARARHG